MRERQLKELAAAPSIQGVDYVTTKGVMSRRSRTKVANIPGPVFATAMMEMASVKAPDGASLEGRVEALARYYDGSPLGQFLATVTHEGDDLTKVTDQISGWFDAQMVRVTQTYRKNIKYILAVIGLLVAVVGNIDSLQVADALKGNADLRQVIVATAGKVEPDAGCTVNESDPTKKTLECGLQDLASFNAMGVVIPMSDGAVARWQKTWSWETAAPHLLGLAVTTGAVALGGPMWFDFLMLLTGRKKSG